MTGVLDELRRLPQRLAADPRLVRAGARLDTACLIGMPGDALLMVFRDGRIVGEPSPPGLMAAWRFAFRATERAWTEHWQPMPRPGWHDLFAMMQRGEAAVEGDLQPFMTHLQFFKDLLALPRGHAG